MGERHATAKELELYVLGALDASRAEAFEAHCAACDACAAALTSEAKLEIAFEGLAHASVRMTGAPRRRAVAYGAAGMLAMAAAALLWIGRASAPAAVGAEASAPGASHGVLDDGAILDARNDALDGG